ncbi:hypothetical protein EPUS_08940 [Endocarpon pusillum Z07020]|uniref:Uncharacterized protein n=1 Tax=Endocarpon pusillum (strain Z07020 / HMAS-L-300199) TaxID=1263415 RepID=U1HYE7_ENDPU|nr:uncharacterized protein EPUS_08940 [Endocarpon pusillum Z07020]ERF74529.1 hypothetical protein EPUS_08940 [Endocarpon pusillum Z07020]
MDSVTRLLVLTVVLLLTKTTAVGIVQREPCPENYKPCSLPGVSKSSVPVVDNSLSGLYVDLVSSVKPQPVIRDLGANQVHHQARDMSVSICCAEGIECRQLNVWDLPFCWDRFTTNFFLPDGSYGNLFTGYYNSASGAIANLVSGDIALPNGRTANIYSDAPQARPVTSLLAVPTPWTSKGLGTAIPNSELGAAPSYAATPAETTLALVNSLSFPSMTSIAEPTGTPITLNVTSYPGSYGFGPPPTPNTTSVIPSMGAATTNGVRGTHLIFTLTLLGYFVNIIGSSSFA